jgi:alpha-beta hydrolase superfamily lysophospholipase
MLQEKQPLKSQKIIHEEYTWKSSDGKSIFAQKWDSGSAAKGAILFVHGFAEYSSRYHHWATSFAENGFCVLSFDLRGHGKTAVKFGEYAAYDAYMSDIQMLIDKGKEYYPELPLFLYGHSMGGNLVVNYAIRHCIDLAGIVITSPWFELTASLSRIQQSLVSFGGRYFPRIIVSSPIRAEDVSRELREVHKYKNDPMIHNKISLGFLKDVLENGITGKRSIHRINVPLLVMHGSADKITSFNASKEFVMNSGPKTTFISWPGAFHELHNDLDRDGVRENILNWMNEQISK